MVRLSNQILKLTHIECLEDSIKTIETRLNIWKIGSFTGFERGNLQSKNKQNIQKMATFIGYGFVFFS